MKDVVVQQEQLRTMQSMARMRGMTLDLSKNQAWAMQAAAFLRSKLGVKLTAYLVELTPHMLGRVARGQAEMDRRNIGVMQEVFEITNILLSTMTPEDARLWWVEPNEYMGYFLPLDEVYADPGWVRSAALSLVVAY